MYHLLHDAALVAGGATCGAVVALLALDMLLDGELTDRVFKWLFK